MPNWVVNKITVSGEGAQKAIREHLGKDENGESLFDFNTIERMPEELKIEKSSRSMDGFRLYIAKINPLIPNLGKRDDKMLPMEKFLKKMVNLFGKDCIDRIECYIIKPKEVDRLKDKYGDKLDDVITLGEKAFRNVEKYGATDWYDWSIEHWGTKWNSCNTMVSEDGKTVWFDTAWAPSTEAISKFAKMHPDLEITHEFAEEQMGFYSGMMEYKDGKMVENTEFAPYSKEAYEMSFELWGCEDEYRFDEKKGTYVRLDDEEEKGAEME